MKFQFFPKTTRKIKAFQARIKRKIQRNINYCKSQALFIKDTFLREWNKFTKTSAGKLVLFLWNWIYFWITYYKKENVKTRKEIKKQKHEILTETSKVFIKSLGGLDNIIKVKYTHKTWTLWVHHVFLVDPKMKFFEFDVANITIDKNKIFMVLGYGAKPVGKEFKKILKFFRENKSARDELEKEEEDVK